MACNEVRSKIRDRIADWDWAQTLVRFTTSLPPDEIVQSVRVIPIVGGEVVVCWLGDGTPFLPGGTREPGESAGDCLRRELIEEAGFEFCDAPLWIGAHSGISYADGPYRKHTPFPLKSWLWGVVNGEFTGPPTNPIGDEQVARVETMSPTKALATLDPIGRGYSEALSFWLEHGGAAS